MMQKSKPTIKLNNVINLYYIKIRIFLIAPTAALPIRGGSQVL